MTPTGTPADRAAAARANADWCAAVCRSHGIASTFGTAAWRTARRPPPYHPDAVTLSPGATPADVLTGVDTASPGCSVKDSFAALDLTAYGFTELFTARWVVRPPVPVAAALTTRRVRTAADLRAWQAAWHGGGAAPDVFRPALLADPAVRVLAVCDGGRLRGGAVLNRSATVVGVSNVFAVGGAAVAAVWSSVVAAAAGRHPGLPLAGYERGADLTAALDCGFADAGPLRVWRRGSTTVERRVQG